MSERAQYRRDTSGELWWCNSHTRQATHVRIGGNIERHCCDTELGGILLPCLCVNLTGLVEIEPS